VTEGPPYVHTLGATRSPALTVRRLLPSWEPPWPPMRGPVLAGRPCATCTHGQPPRVLPIDWPLPPFEFAEPTGERWPYRLECYGAWPFPNYRLSSVI
jgi:hypothetical protein